jgi:transposase
MQTCEELLAENAALRAENAALKAEVAALLARVAELEARLGMNSRNSSKPPSSDPPNAAARPKKKPTGRRPGGQPGHKGTTRFLLPPEKVKRIIDLRPPECERCRAKLEGDDPKPRRLQVTDVPPVEPDVTEYRRHTLTCNECGARTTATLPPGAGEGAFAPRLKAMLAMCSAVYRLSRRTVEGLMSDFFDVDISLGSVSACEEAVSEAVAEPVAEARKHVEAAPVAHADETGFREVPAEGGPPKKAWLWAAVTPLVTVFLVHAKRGAVAARDLLGSFAGVLVSDRWSAYGFIDAAKRQLCWAHLIRDFEWIAEFGAEATGIGRALLAETKRMFGWWHELKAGGLTRSGFQKRMAPLMARVGALLDEGAACSHKKSAGRCRQILKLRAALWTFVAREGVEPTNNAAERALRPAVIWRKLSFGSASDRGSRFVERMLTVAATCRQQGRNVLEYLAAACEAHARGEPAPPLLPAAARSTAA